MGLMIGLDVGSTTVKACVVDPLTDQILWSDYQRHGTKQPDVVLDFLKRITRNFAIPNEDYRIFVTGSGGSTVGARIGAKFVQEVNAVSLAVEKLYPKTGSVIELGGQDAKMIFYRTDNETGKKKKVPTMNDKCAGGTGAVIDKINTKLGLLPVDLCGQGHNGVKIHHIAGKCGVFAETDVNTLQKQGVPVDEIMASLFDSIIGQNLSVLTRGNTLTPLVLLLGGPNTYIRGMLEAWRYHIPRIWEERKVPIPQGVPIEELIIVPKNAHLFAAIGAVEFGKEEDAEVGVFTGIAPLEYYLEKGRDEEMEARMKKNGSGGLSKDSQDLERFKEAYKPYSFINAPFPRGEVVQGFIGIDGGSTSTKAVLLNHDKEILCKTYQLSKGNPIQDTKDVLGKLREMVESQGATLEVLGVGTTGYAKDVLKDALNADVALVETVAHTEAALHYYPDVDVICDVGGQDIKVIVLQDGRVKDFKLNTQCSAGNGYFLQSTASGFGYSVEEFADIAFSADKMPSFGYGCAVFMQSDIVDFQRQGWAPKEIMAGLANVLPKNIWLYVSQIPNLAKLGSQFVLQGGTQHNLAAVKSQVDFINSRFNDGEKKPNVFVHKHTGESGAIGAALEAVRLYQNGQRTQFIGLGQVAQIEYETATDERTRCYFCKNNCLRTFIDIKNQKEDAPSPTFQSKVPLKEGMSRVIIATCEKGTVEDINAMRNIKAGLDAAKKANPNFVAVGAKAIWDPVAPASVADPIPTEGWTEGSERRIQMMKRRGDLRIGIPRVLNQYSVNPFFSAYFESLGVKAQNLVYSDFTDENLYKEGAKRGAIDPCFPSKVGIPHVHNLLFVHHKKKKLDYIFFPMIDCLPTFLDSVVASRSCPTVATTPEAVKAAFTKESDFFKENGIIFLDTFLNIGDPSMLRKQMYDQFKDILGLSLEENTRAVEVGLTALENFYEEKLRRPAREVLKQLERENRIGIVMLGRPYHNDPGINHGILDEFQKMEYPVFSQDSLPIDAQTVLPLFREEIERGDLKSAFDISDAWKNAYSENTNRKVWAAKFTARHPNLVALELSSFKCGHDAPIYTVIEETVVNSGTPYFSFKDIDENKPTGSIKIRLETIHYFLKRYTEDLRKGVANKKELERRLLSLETKLREEMGITFPSETPKASPISPPAQPNVIFLPTLADRKEDHSLDERKVATG